MNLSPKEIRLIQLALAKEYAECMGIRPHKDSNSNKVKWGYSFETTALKKDSKGEVMLSLAGNDLHNVRNRNKTYNKGKKNPLATFTAPTTGLAVTKKIVKERKIKTYKPWSLK